MKLLFLTLVAVCLVASNPLNTEAQTVSSYANCISMKMVDNFVQLNMDEDCDEAQWSQAVAHYKANGYPHEDSYMDMFGSKFIQLDSDKWVQDKADLDEYLKGVE
jgi:hypothetical protein